MGPVRHRCTYRVAATNIHRREEHQHAFGPRDNVVPACPELVVVGVEMQCLLPAARPDNVCRACTRSCAMTCASCLYRPNKYKSSAKASTGTWRSPTMSPMHFSCQLRTKGATTVSRTIANNQGEAGQPCAKLLRNQIPVCLASPVPRSGPTSPSSFSRTPSPRRMAACVWGPLM